MSGKPSLNDDFPEEDAELPAPPEHGFVTLCAGLSMCQVCGTLWDWDEPRPDGCPPCA